MSLSAQRVVMTCSAAKSARRLRGSRVSLTFLLMRPRSQSVVRRNSFAAKARRAFFRERGAPFAEVVALCGLIEQLFDHTVAQCALAGRKRIENGFRAGDRERRACVEPSRERECRGEHIIGDFIDKADTQRALGIELFSGIKDALRVRETDQR